MALAREKMEGKNKSCGFGIWIIVFAALILALSGCRTVSVDEISLEKLAELPKQHAVVVVNFWATWCAPCLAEIPHLNRLHQERPDVRVYGISIDDAALGQEVFKFVGKYKIRYPVYIRKRMSGQESKQEWYKNVDLIPVTYIFKDGKLHNTILGAVGQENELAQAIDGASEEEQIAEVDDETEQYSDKEEE